ncbi:MAG: dihydrodipicolinate synthase family protein, partial [Victivallales bacterium]|nr:dihydrodipicolinate synthase family protein [Victivallales bacterium]
YHAPANNNLQLSSEQIARMASHPKCAGIKNSAGSMNLRKELLLHRQSGNFRLLEGHEWAIDEALMLGCDGAVCGLGALAAKPLAQMAEAAEAGDWDTLRRIQFKLLPLFKAVYGTTSWLGQKYALKTLGIISSAHCRIQPESMLSAARRQEIEDYLKDNIAFLE